ncbi:MAG: hypothetical protein AB7F75_06125 [Planctomycetota bacterium]
MRILAILTLVLSSCAEYWPDRGRDFMDIGTLTLDAGPGLGLQVQITEALRLGWEREAIWRAGASGRFAGLWKEERSSESISLLENHHLAIKSGTVAGTEYWNDYCLQAEAPSSATVFALQRRHNTDEGKYGALKDRQLLDVGYSIHLGYVGISHDFRPAEVLDFILGFFMFDFRGDDLATLDSRRGR